MGVDLPEPRDSSRAVAANSKGTATRNGTYLLTWTTYGTWLPGDKRGFVSRALNGEKSHPIHNTPGQPYDEDQPAVERAARTRQKGETVKLNHDHADVCAAAIREVADRYAIAVHAAAIMPTHVHLVATSKDADGAKLLNLFKGVASRRLGQRFDKRAGGTWWTRHGSRRLLSHQQAVEAAIRYVRNQPSPLILFGNTT